MKNRTRIVASVLMILFSVISLSIVLTVIDFLPQESDEMTPEIHAVLVRFEIGSLHAFIVTKPMWSVYPSLPDTEMLWANLSSYFFSVNAILLFIYWFGRRCLKKPIPRPVLCLVILVMSVGMYFILNSIQYSVMDKTDQAYFYLWLFAESFCLQVSLLQYTLLWCIGLSLFDIREVIRSRTPATTGEGWLGTGCCEHA